MVVIETLFATLFAVSVSTTLALLPLLLLSPLARRRYPARWSCLLWFVIAVRFLIPFNFVLPSSPMQITLPNEITRPITGAPMLPAVGQEPAPPAPGGTLPPATAAPSFSLHQLAAIAWPVGMILYLVIQGLL